MLYGKNKVLSGGGMLYGRNQRGIWVNKGGLWGNEYDLSKHKGVIWEHRGGMWGN